MVCVFLNSWFVYQIHCIFVNASLHLCGELANSWFVFTLLCSDMALHAFSLMGLLIDISSFHDNIELPPNYETISYSVSSSRSQQTRPCVPKATPYKGSPTVLWTSVPEGQSCAKHVIIYIENIRLENFVLRTFLLSSGHPGPTGNTINKDLDLCKRASDWKIDLLSFRCTGMNTQNLHRNTK